jgi:hypothetical protein
MAILHTIMNFLFVHPTDTFEFYLASASNVSNEYV